MKQIIIKETRNDGFKVEFNMHLSLTQEINLTNVLSKLQEYIHQDIYKNYQKLYYSINKTIKINKENNKTDKNVEIVLNNILQIINE